MTASSVSKQGMRKVLSVTFALLFCLDDAVAKRTLSCPCRTTGMMCLTEGQVSKQVSRIEMEPDRMGNHTNLRGIAVFQVTFDENGRVVSARAISGHPLAIEFLVTAAERWRFKPYLQNGVARKVCGRLRVKFSMIENKPSAEVLKPSVD